jgi:sec-independent protein translocase protein TatC
MTNLPGALAVASAVREHLATSRRQQDRPARTTLVDHIRELRNRIVKMALALTAGLVVGLIWFNQAWRVIQRPLCTAHIRGYTGCSQLGVDKLVLDGPLDSFYLRVKVAFIVGVVLSSPIWLYQIWAFVAPGLYARERRWSYVFLGTAVPLFGLGVALCYLSLGHSIQYMLGLTPQGVSNLIEVDQYMSLVMTMMLAFGLAFEVPLLIIMLNLVGLLTHERFRKWRRTLIFALFVIAGVANPSPDPLTMIILAGTCVALVEAAEFIIWANDRRRARLQPAPYAGLADDELSALEPVRPPQDR